MKNDIYTLIKIHNSVISITVYFLVKRLLRVKVHNNNENVQHFGVRATGLL